jgi:hypothetical protein
LFLDFVFVVLPLHKRGVWHVRRVRLAYQPPASSTFISQQTNHQKPANSIFLSKQTSTSQTNMLVKWQELQ